MHAILTTALLAVILATAWPSKGLSAEPVDEATRPKTSQDQGLNFRNSVPTAFDTVIIAANAADRARAQEILEIYRVLESDPSIANMRRYIASGYIQHNTVIPDGPEPLAMVFSSSVAQYPVAIDIHKVMVLGDWAMAHVNFRNLSSNNPNDLGIAAVDIYRYNADGKVIEHWDVLQGVPTHSANPNGMFLPVYDEE